MIRGGRGIHGPLVLWGLLALLMIILGGGCTPMPIYTSRHYSPPTPRPKPEPVVDSTTPSDSVLAQIPEPATVDTVDDTPEVLEQLPLPENLPVIAPTREQQSRYRVGQVLTGRASYYGPGFHGKQTANGEIYNQNALTCAHRELPFGTILEVTFTKTGRGVRVRVNDRGPYKRGRILDLSVAAARRIGLEKAGVGKVSAKIIRIGK